MIGRLGRLDRTALDVGSGQRRQLLVGRFVDRRKAVGLPADSFFEEVAHVAGVAEAGSEARTR